MHPMPPLPFSGSVGRSHESEGPQGTVAKGGLSLPLYTLSYILPHLPPQNPPVRSPSTQNEVPNPCHDLLGKPIWPALGYLASLLP